MTKRNPHPDNELIDELTADGTPGQQSRSGGNIARDVGTRAELDRVLRGEGVERVTGKDNPQAVAGVFREFDTSLAALHRDAAQIWLVAQALRDPGNLGTMLRTGDAVGAGGLILIDDCADPFSVEAVRASMGAVFTQRVAQARWDDFLGWLRGGAGQLVAASLRDAQDYRTAPYAAPCFLMVGSPLDVHRLSGVLSHCTTTKLLIMAV